ncbi:hypothetical protein Tco_0482213 [Tanacetum coccineum]
MLSLLTNGCIGTALTIQPSAIYVEYLRDFWYTTEKPLAYQVALTSHMLKVAKLFQEPKQSLILSSKKVNANDGADKVILPKRKRNKVLRLTWEEEWETAAMLMPPESRSLSDSAEDQGDVTFDQLMDEIDQKNKAAQEQPKSPYDTESEIKIIKRFHPSQPDDDVQITFLGVEPLNFEYDQTKLLETLETINNVTSKESTAETFNASTDMPAQLDPIGHLYEELRTLNTKVDQLESSISKKVTDDIQSFVPSNYCRCSKSTFSWSTPRGFKNTLPRVFKDSIQQSIQELIEEKLLQFDAQAGGVSQKQEENTSEKKVSNDEPPVKKLKFLIPTSSSILSPTPLKSILTKPIQKPDATKKTIEQFTEHLNKTTSSIFSSTSLRDPTPPKDESKGKGITSEEPLKEIMPFMEEGGLIPKITSLKSFVIPEGKLTNEDVMAQVKEMKRLANLKAEKEKSEKSLQKIMNPATIRAQAQKMAAYKAKIKKMLDEYNHQISHTADQLPITKIRLYKV